jgi:hypothetical protein
MKMRLAVEGLLQGSGASHDSGYFRISPEQLRDKPLARCATCADDQCFHHCVHSSNLPCGEEASRSVVFMYPGPFFRNIRVAIR